MSHQTKKIIQLLIVILIGGFFIYFSFKGTDWNDLLSKISEANIFWLVIGMLISLTSHWLRAYRATLLYDAMNYKISTKSSFYAVLIGYMMNYFIPRAGEVSRCASLSKTDNLPVEKSLGSVVTERIVDMVLLILILGGIFLLQFDLILSFIETATGGESSEGKSNFPWKIIVLGFITVTAIIVYLIKDKLVKMPLYIRIFKLLQGFSDGLLSIRHLKNPMLFLILSVLIWVGYILMMYFCLFSLEATSHLTFSDCLTVFAIGTVGVVLPAPGAGAGTYHFFVMQSLLLFGVAKEDGLAYATLVHGIQMMVLITIGLVASGIIYLGQKNNGQIKSNIS